MKLIDRLIYLLIEHNKNSSIYAWLCIGFNEGTFIGFWIFMWIGIILFPISFLLFKPTIELMCVILAGLIFSIILAIVLGTRQNRGKIKDVPISISDKTLKVILAIYIVLPLISVLVETFVLLTYNSYGWFSSVFN